MIKKYIKKHLNNFYSLRKIRNTISTLKNENCSLIIDDFNLECILNTLQKCGFGGLYIEPLSIHQKPSICLLEASKIDFINSFLKLISENDIRMKYKAKGQYKEFKSNKALWLNLITAKSFDVILNSDKEPQHIFLRIQFWKEAKEYFLSYNGNHISRKLWKNKLTSELGIFSENKFINYNEILKLTHEHKINFDIDLVFTWVNSEDEKWKTIYNKYRPDIQSDATSTSRFLSRDELKYALRSWSKHGTFINKIHIVSNCSAPSWLDLNNNKINWVDHETIIENEFLPTFSSHAIETAIHKIPGLSNNFIYSNDDFLLVKDTESSDFFFPNGIAKLRLEDYGNVNGYTNIDNPDYLNAAINSNSLLEKHFQKSTTQLHTHSPQSMRVDLLNELEELFLSSFNKTRSNKFRKEDDIAVTGYLYHHYALLSGNAIQSDTKTELIQQNHGFKTKFSRLLSLKKKNMHNKLPLSVCINDGADSHLNESWNTSVNTFLDKFYPEKSEYEK